MRHGLRFLLFCLVALAYLSCAGRGGGLVRRELFSLDYGPGSHTIDFSRSDRAGVDVVLDEGIFYLLDTGGGKLLKLSAYGDFLDAPSTRFRSPSALAVGSGRIVYIADRVESDRPFVYDSASRTYSGYAVRRIDAEGKELPWLGQEGPGGTAFPPVQALTILDDGSLVVVSSSDSVLLVHRFTKEGALLSMLSVPRGSLPVPDESAFPHEGAEKATESAPRANLDSFVLSSDATGFRIHLKIDYYGNSSGAEETGSARTGPEYLGSWVETCDGATGTVLSETPVRIANTDEIPRLVAYGDGAYRFLAGSSLLWTLSTVELSGAVRRTDKLALPEDAEGALIDLKMTPDGKFVGLFAGNGKMTMYMWGSG